MVKNLLLVPQQSETKIQIPSQGYRTLLVAPGHSTLPQLSSTVTLLQPYWPPLFSFHFQDLCPGCSLILAHSSSLCGVAGCLKVTFLTSHGHHPTLLCIFSITLITNCDYLFSPVDLVCLVTTVYSLPSTELEMVLIMILKGEKLQFRSLLCEIPILILY